MLKNRWKSNLSARRMWGICLWNHLGCFRTIKKEGFAGRDVYEQQAYYHVMKKNLQGLCFPDSVLPKLRRKFIFRWPNTCGSSNLESIKTGIVHQQCIYNHFLPFDLKFILQSTQTWSLGWFFWWRLWHKLLQLEDDVCLTKTSKGRKQNIFLLNNALKL